MKLLSITVAAKLILIQSCFFFFCIQNEDRDIKEEKELADLECGEFTQRLN